MARSQSWGRGAIKWAWDNTNKLLKLLFREDSTDGFTDALRINRPDDTVNYLQITDGATGTGVTLEPIGDDDNIDLTLQAKGTGSVVVNDLDIDFTDIDAAVITTSDSVAFIDDTDGNLKKESMADFFGIGPAGVTEAAVDESADYVLFLDGGATGAAKKESIADLVAAIDDGTTLTASSGQLSVKTATFAQKIPLNAFKQTGNMKDALPDAADGTDLGLADAAGSPLATTAVAEDVDETDSADCYFTIPPNYKADEAFAIQVRCKIDTDAKTDSTVDLEVKEVADGTLGADICGTAATSIQGQNAYADNSFTITDTNLAPGDLLHIKLTAAVDAGAAGTSQISIAEVRPEYTGYY